MTTPIALIYETMPPTSGGGCAPRGDAFARALAAHGSFGPVAVHTTTSDPSPIAGVDLHPIGRQSAQNQGLVHRLGGEIVFGLRTALRVLRSGRDTVWLISTPSYVAMLLTSLAARMRRARYVLDVRDIYPQAYIAAGLIKPNGVIAKMSAWFSKRAYLRATTILAATEGLRTTLQSLVPPASIYTIINGFSVDRATIRPLLHERFTVCFHGVLGYFQDGPALLEVGRRLQEENVDLVVIGYGRDAHLFEDAPPANISFLGRLPYDRTMQEVARCHVGLSLRKDEEISADSFPVKVWEYLGLGMPTLVAPLSDAGRFVEQHGCGFMLAAGDVDGAVSHILELRDDPERYRAMSERALIAVAPFSRAAQSMQMAKILAEATQDLRATSVLIAPAGPDSPPADTQENSRRACPE